MADDGPGWRSRFEQGWARYRALPTWLQAVGWVLLGLIVLSALSTDGENTETAGQSEPVTSTTERTATTGVTDTTERPTTTTTESEPTIPSECQEAFKRAAEVDQFRDKHEDLWPAFETCRSVEQFAAASEEHPGALEADVDPQTYVENQCLYEAALEAAPLCEGIR